MSTVFPSPDSRREPSRPIPQAFGLLGFALLVLGVLYGTYAWEAVQREQLRELRGLAELGARFTETRLRDAAAMMSLAAEAVSRASDAGQPADEAVAHLRMALPGLLALAVVTPQGEAVAYSDTLDGMSRESLRRVLAESRPDAPDAVQPGLRVERAVALPGGHDAALLLRLAVVHVAAGTPRTVNVSAFLPFGARAALPDGGALRGDGSAGLLAGDGRLLVQVTGDQSAVVGSPVADGMPAVLPAAAPPSGGVLRPNVLAGPAERAYVFANLERHPLATFYSLPQRVFWGAWFDRVRVPMTLIAMALAGLVFAAGWGHRQQRTRETERDAAEAALHAQDARLRTQAALLDQTQRTAHVGGWELDVASGRLFWTDETYRIFDTTPETFTPESEAAYAFFTPDSRELLRSAIDRSMHSTEPWDLDLELVTARGRGIWLRATGTSELASTGLPVRLWGSFQDVSERHRADDRIYRLAHYDELTSLANRNLFTHHLTHATARAERYGKGLAVLFIDLDRFKIINDTLGHDTGDMVLRTIARRLSEGMRAADLVARLGGDEFVVVAEEIENHELAADIARKLLALVEQPVLYHGQELSLTASIGVAMCPEDGRDLQTLLKHADIAMYRAKDQGKNRYAFYSSGANGPSVDRLSLESRLKRAVLEQNQFVLHYQPKVSVLDGRITGVEALVRWQSPDRGLVLPGDFIPLAEETGLIAAIGEWVLETACRQAMVWLRKGLPAVRVAVNLSARQFYSPGFVDTVKRIIRETGVSPGAVELELTESVMMQNVQQVADLLMELKLLGLHISIDDFGTGYSSLSYLKRLPIDSLKVDRSFVRDIPGDSDDVAIARAVIALAHSLRLKVVAEGVETDSQLGFLRDLRCDEIQGYLFSQPVTAAELEEMLRRDVRLASLATRTAA